MDKSSEAQERDILDDFFKGQINAEECFCMILSLHGFEKAKERLASVLTRLELTRPELHKELRQVHDEYFAENDCLETSVENGYYANDASEDLDFELDMELAIAASLQNSRHKDQSRGVVPTTSYASKLRQHSSDHNDEKPGLGCKTYPDNHGDPVKGWGCDSKLLSKQIPPSNGPSPCQTQTADDASREWKKLPPFSLQTSSPSPILNENANEEQSKGKKKKKRKNKKGSAATANNSTTVGIPRQLTRKPVLLWFRRDLRLYDNPALVSAASKDAPVVPVFVWVEGEEGPLAAGGAVKVWLHHALASLDAALRDRLGSALVFRHGSSSKVELERLVRETGADTVVLNAQYEPVLRQRDQAVQKSMESRGVAMETHHSYLLHHPDSLHTETCGMRGLGSVTHFMECARRSATAPIGRAVDAPPTLPRPASLPQSWGLDSLGLARMPCRKDGTVIDWAADIRKSWDFSEDGAWKAMELFLEEGIRSYEKESGRVDKLHTCRISPYLHFGQVSPRAVLESARHCKSPKFLRKLAWRDLAYWLLHLFPSLPSQPTRPHYREQYWSSNRAHLRAWQRGRTGYPLVDACMRQLWSTGWMNNYGRHVVASFLIAYLHLHWEHGYKWFQDTLLDADVAINAMMWQNGGMSGLDQWNFVMHPVDAAMTCDPKGAFVRQWCPELAGLPDDYVHQPWKCPPSVRRRAGVELGVNYPERIITDLEEAREASLAAVVSVRLAHPEFIDPHTGNDLVPLTSGLLLPVITRREFKYRTREPQARDNPYTAVLRGYRSRKRDELIAWENQVDFKASTLAECSQRFERYQKAAGMSSL